MQGLSFQLPRLLELKIPPVVRYIERKYMEDFFRTGQLKLTTYTQCQVHECNVRRDSNEGKAKFSLELPSVGASGWGIQTVGWQSYILCASLCESDKLLEHFKVDSYFRINNVLGFFDAVSRRLSGFENGKIGSCIYRDKNSFEKSLKFNEISQNSSNVRNNKELTLAPIEFEMSDEPYFIKSDSFAAEAEFRFIWSLSNDVREPITVYCPEAIQFCEPDLPVSDKYTKPNNSGDIRSSMLIGNSFG